MSWQGPGNPAQQPVIGETTLAQRPMRIIIADDHPIFRRGLKQVIEDDANLHVVGEAENGVVALKMIEK